MNGNARRVSDLLQLLHRLAASNIHYKLAQFRDDAVAIEVTVPGERWEIEFMADGSIEVERFKSDGTIGGEEMLDELFRAFSN